jgi:hypothetical protein
MRGVFDTAVIVVVSAWVTVAVWCVVMLPFACVYFLGRVLGAW